MTDTVTGRKTNDAYLRHALKHSRNIFEAMSMLIMSLLPSTNSNERSLSRRTKSTTFAHLDSLSANGSNNQLSWRSMSLRQPTPFEFLAMRKIICRTNEMLDMQTRRVIILPSSMSTPRNDFWALIFDNAVQCVPRSILLWFLADTARSKRDKHPTHDYEACSYLLFDFGWREVIVLASYHIANLFHHDCVGLVIILPGWNFFRVNAFAAFDHISTLPWWLLAPSVQSHRPHSMPKR
jgi:hypothetical protein